MINALLITPIILSVLVLVIRNKVFDTLIADLYAAVHFVLTILIIWGDSKYKSGIPYFAADNTNMIFLFVLSFVFLMISVYNTGYIKTIDTPPGRISRYSCMLIIFVWSMTGTVLSTDLGISWILIEATTLSSAYLIYFEKTKNSIEAAWKYVFICSIGIALAFVGIIFLNIAASGVNTLNYAELYKNAESFDIQWLKMALVFMVFGFGAKMGLAPAHFWLPDAHSEAPAPVSALLSAALLNSAFLVIVRVYKIIETAGYADFIKPMLLIMGFLSLFTAAVFLFHIKNYKRMLAYSSIENMGILIIGLALGGSAYIAVILHLIGHSLAKASFFLSSGNILHIFQTRRIKSVSGIISADFVTGRLWILSFLAICAFPSSLVFISEFLMIKSMILNKNYILCALFAVLLTIILYGMAKVVIKMSCGLMSEDKAEIVKTKKEDITIFMYIPQIIMLIIIFTLGIYIPANLNVIINLAASAF